MRSDPADDGSLRRRWASTALLLAVAAGGAADLALDSPSETNRFHLAFEGALLALSLGTIAWLWIGWARTRGALANATQAASARSSERDAWRARAETLLRLEAIEAQFERWNLSAAERETALLLLEEATATRRSPSCSARASARCGRASPCIASWGSRAARSSRRSSSRNPSLPSSSAPRAGDAAPR